MTKKTDDDPAVISLESHRRKRLADSRRRQDESRKRARSRPGQGERAINWRRVPLLLAVVAAFLVLGWLLRQAGGLMGPLH